MANKGTGRWVTVKGRHIFIEDGQSIGDAFKAAKFKGDKWDAREAAHKALKAKTVKRDTKKFNAENKDRWVKRVRNESGTKDWMSDKELREYNKAMDKANAEVEKLWQKAKANGMTKKQFKDWLSRDNYS